MRYVIQKIDWDVKSIVLKFPNDQAIMNIKQGNAASEIPYFFLNFWKHEAFLDFEDKELFFITCIIHTLI